MPPFARRAAALLRHRKPLPAGRLENAPEPLITQLHGYEWRLFPRNGRWV